MIKIMLLSEIIRKEEFFTPKNLEQEKKTFFSNNDYEPQFEYEELDFSPEEIKKKLEQEIINNKIEDERIKTLHQGSIRELMLYLELLTSRGEKDFTHKNLILFGNPNPKIIKQAKEIISETKNNNLTTKTNQDKKITLEEAKKLITEQITLLGAKEWTVTEEETTLKDTIKISPAYKKIIINTKKTLTKKELEKEITKKIIVTLQRQLNGQKQTDPFLGVSTEKFFETEEGLKLLLTQKKDLLTKEDLIREALTIIATKEALTKSFREVYEELRKKIPEEQAFEITAKIKSGLKNTKEPGAYLKPSLGFTGLQKLKTLNDEDIKILLNASIGMNELPIIKELIKEKIIRETKIII